MPSLASLVPIVKSGAEGATSPAVKHEINKLGFKDLGFNDLILTTLTFNNPWIQQHSVSTNEISIILTFNDPWIQQPFDSTVLNKLGFNNPWVQ